MKSFEGLHIRHEDVSSDVLFLKKEIEFLLKILRNCYSTSVKLEKIKLLDGYWKGFEQNIGKLDLLLERINKDENAMAVVSQDGLINEEQTHFNRDSFRVKLKAIDIDVRLLKETFYELMEGCGSCALKTNEMNSRLVSH